MFRATMIGAAVALFWCPAFAQPADPQVPDPAPDAPPAPDTPAEVPAGPQLTRAPELLEFVEATHPAAALAEKRTGAVVVALTIQEDGSVADVEVVEPAGHGFDAAAVAAVQQFTFRPAELDGKPGAVRITYRYVFTLEEEVVEVKAPETPTGVLRGQLLERGTRAPLVGVKVSLPATAAEAFSDAEGRFEFTDVAEGTVVIVISDPVFADVEDEETVKAGEATEVRYYLQRDAFDDSSIQVVGRRPKKQVVRRTLAVQEILTIPGTQGDALKVVQNLPGAARQSFSNEIVLRGGGTSQAYLDQHAIPLAFHFGGLRSTVASALIESIDVYPGNYGVEYGRVNGGIIDIRLRRPATDGLHGYAEVDVFDAGFLIEGPITDDWSFALAARRSYIDAILLAVLPDEIRETFSVAPRYYDGQLLVEGKTGKHTVRAIAYGSNDQFRIIFDEDPDRAGDGVSLTSEWAGGRAEWTYRHDADITNTLSLSYTAAGLRFSGNPGLAQDFELDLVSQLVTLRDDLKIDLDDWISLRVGTDSIINIAAVSGRVTPPGKEGEPDPNGPPEDFETSLIEFEDSPVWVSPALYTEVEMKFGPVTVLPGLRADWFGPVDEFLLQPRLSARYKALPKTVIKGAVGLYAEAPAPDELVPDLGNPDLGLETSVQYSLGFEQTLAEGLTLDILGFYKTLEELVTRSADPEERYTNRAEGRVFGMELLLRQELTNRLFGWVAYTLMRSERKDAPGEDYRPFDLDQTHNLVVVAQYKITPTWEVGLRWRYVTGDPSTPAVGADFDADTGGYVPRYGATNSDRLDAFHQLDLRVDKHWVFDTWRLTTYLDVQNVYNRANPEEIEYQYDYADSAVQAGLPIIPSIGLRGSF